MYVHLLVTTVFKMACCSLLLMILCCLFLVESTQKIKRMNKAASSLFRNNAEKFLFLHNLLFIVLLPVNFLFFCKYLSACKCLIVV